MKVKRKEEIQHKKPNDNYEYAHSAPVFHSKQLFLYSEKVLPGKKASKPHFHKALDEIAVITKGELTAYEGDESIVLKAGDSIMFEANSRQLHYLENHTQEEAEFLLFRKSIKQNDVVTEGYSFAEVVKEEFEMIVRWRKEEHVSSWWDDFFEDEDEWIEELTEHLDTDKGKQFICSFNGEPFAFIQYYYCHKLGDGWWSDYPEGVVGLDLFIGEKKYLSAGHGTQMLKEFVSQIIKPLNIDKLIADPEPDNKKAIAAFEKAGFINEGKIKTPDGKAVLLVYEF